MSKKKNIRLSRHGKKTTRIIGWVSEIISTKSIRTFTQQPPADEVIEGTRLSGEPASRIGAHDLFSMFTADIIKERTRFTR